MTDQPRLTDAARAAIEGHMAGVDLGMKVSDLPSLGDTRMSDEYRRGWNDCRTLILKILGEPR